MLASYDLSIVAATGGSLSAIQSSASINDSGKVAFLGSDSSGNQAVYVGSTAGAPGIVSFGPTANRTYGRELQINNAGLVAAVDRSGTSPVFWTARLWDSHAPGTFDVMARSISPRPTIGFPPFDFPDPSFNNYFDTIATATSVSNDGAIAIAGLESTAWEIHLDDDEITATGPGSLQTSWVATLATGTFFRVMAADGSRTALARRTGGVDEFITVYDTTLLDSIEFSISTTSGNWAELGVRPGISDDGNAIAFYGVLTAGGATNINAAQPTMTPLVAGEGIFAAIYSSGRWRIHRIAGIAGNGVLDPNETYTDENANGAFDPGTDVERGVSAFQQDARPSLARSTATPSLLHSTWIGTDSRTGAETIFAANVRTTYSRSTLSNVLQSRTRIVVSVGDDIPGLGSATDLDIHDAVNGKGQVAFFAAAGGSQGVVVAEPTPPKVVVVNTHGFGNAWHLGPASVTVFPGFLGSWQAMGNLFETLPSPGSALDSNVESYVTEWNSSDGWIDAFLSVAASVVLRAQGDVDAAEAALLAAFTQMRVAANNAQRAAETIVSDLISSGQLPDPALTTSGEQVIQLVGHSRGAAVNAQVARILAGRGYKIEQYISLDGYSNDWPGISNVLGDIDIADAPGMTNGVHRVVEHAINYMVTDGLDDVAGPLLSTLAEAIADFTGFAALNAETRATIVAAMTGWKAPARSGFTNTIITAPAGTNHITVVPRYLEDLSYIHDDSYVGMHRDDEVLPSVPAAERDILAAVMPDLTAAFVDGDFSASKVLADELAAEGFAENPDSFIQAWGTLQSDSRYVLGAHWETEGDVELATAAGNPAVRLTADPIASLGQALVLTPDVESIDVLLAVEARGDGGRLEVLVDGIVIGEHLLADSTEPQSLSFPLARTATSTSVVTFVLTSFGAAPAVVLLDDIELQLARVDLPGDYNNDSVVDGGDFLAWQQTLGQPADPPGSGTDGNGNGVVDGGDLSVWTTHFTGGLTATAASAGYSQAISKQPVVAGAADAIFAAGDWTSMLATRPMKRPLGRGQFAKPR